ncbi:MAG: LysR family transcriptional regulator [Clostridia bacterium]|nr:LysR family transcriptional regulator [Clostridia bacterium]
MNENQIDTFLEIAQTGSFSRAAQNMHISQPAVTYRMRMLEEELGTKLFDCAAFAAELTPAGEAFVQEATALREMFEKARIRMLEFLPESVITLGFPDMMLHDGRAFLRIMDQCSREIGGSDGRLIRSKRLDKAPAHVQQLLRGEVDLIFGDLGLEELDSDKFECRRLFDERACVCMNRTHPLAQKKSLKAADLQGETIYLYEDETSFPMRARELLLEKNIEPADMSFPSFVQVLPHLLLGNGVAITNQQPVTHDRLVFLPLDMERTIDIGIAWVRSRTTPRLRQAVRIIENMPWSEWM